ncbi:DsrE family protein [Pedobacter jamesrossensis]|uniref:DsrE family protein n=1 Tax=Pedobacter jamesrossensis TaxID=1908238 RepID=A0ABV8NMF6_9SPHI
MKKLLILFPFVLVMAITTNVCAQETKKPFTGAVAKKKSYKALYVLNSSEEKHISGTLRNINNALEDPRLKGKLEVELIAFGDGVAVYRTDGKFLNQLNTLKSKGVILAQCENTVRERKIDKSDLFDFISFVPSGNGEIIIRSAEGWVIVHP